MTSLLALAIAIALVCFFLLMKVGPAILELLGNIAKGVVSLALVVVICLGCWGAYHVYGYVQTQSAKISSVVHSAKEVGTKVSKAGSETKALVSEFNK